MAASSGSGTSSGSILLTTSGSEEDLRQHAAADLRRLKRKVSNRESARRSRMRKQRHLDDLTAQVAGLRQENAHILTNLKAVTQRCLAVEAENSVLREQVAELGGRLHSLQEMLQYVDDDSSGDGGFGGEGGFGGGGGFTGAGFLMNPWKWSLRASDVLQY